MKYALLGPDGSIWAVCDTELDAENQRLSQADPSYYHIEKLQGERLNNIMAQLHSPE